MDSMTVAMPFTPSHPIDRRALSALGFTYPPAPEPRPRGRHAGERAPFLSELRAVGMPIRGQGRHIARGNR